MHDELVDLGVDLASHVLLLFRKWCIIIHLLGQMITVFGLHELKDTGFDGIDDQDLLLN